MGLIYFNGKCSADYGFEVAKPPKHKFPRRIYEIESIAGKDGDSAYDTGSYSNVDRDYEISFIAADAYDKSVRSILNFLHSGHGYLRLEDTYEPEYYREAIFEKDGEITNYYHQGGTLTMTFNCKPKCWLKVGEVPIYAYGDEPPIEIQNGTIYPAKPLITAEVTGEGSIEIGSYKIDIVKKDGVAYSGTMILDSEKQDAYYEGQNLNGYITLESKYPILVPGNNVVTLTGGINSVAIIPRWWVL